MLTVTLSYFTFYVFPRYVTVVIYVIFISKLFIRWQDKIARYTECPGPTLMGGSPGELSEELVT